MTATPKEDLAPLSRRTSDWLQQSFGLPSRIGEPAGETVEYVHRVARRFYEVGQAVVDVSGACVEAFLSGDDSDMVEGPDGIVRFNNDGLPGHPEERPIEEFDSRSADRG